MEVRLLPGGVIVYWFEPFDPDDQALAVERAQLLFHASLVIGAMTSSSFASLQMQIGLAGLTRF